MRDGGRIAAAIEILTDILNHSAPIKSAMRNWAMRARYAGSSDRAWITSLVMDGLRRRASIQHALGEADGRALALGALRYGWGWELKRVEAALAELPHAPPPLTAAEREALLLAPDPAAPLHARGDFPEWLTPHMVRAFGEDAMAEGLAMATRAPVDLRVNLIKADAGRVEKPLASIRAVQHPFLVNGYRAPAEDPMGRNGSVEGIPAYSRGWVEVQDAGSQIAALATRAKGGEQVLDYCAGGGGKTMALASLMNNTGQIYAYDVEPKRLSAIIPRMKRGDVRNVQLRDPRDADPLGDLVGRMDLVLIDAPCSGTGTWRRKPDTKWRLSEQALIRRTADQADILDKAVRYVKPGGRLVYVTCSFLMEENEDQVASFLARTVGFTRESALASAQASGGLTEAGQTSLLKCMTAAGELRLTPMRAGTDGFFIACLRRTG
jgi:16S rRNA (cytosine967-C5)-methyltransferase